MTGYHGLTSWSTPQATLKVESWVSWESDTRSRVSDVLGEPDEPPRRAFSFMRSSCRSQVSCASCCVAEGVGCVLSRALTGVLPSGRLGVEGGQVLGVSD